MPNDFKCAICKVVCTNPDDRTEDEKIKEKEANGWGDVPMEEMVSVCDDCYNEKVVPILNIQPSREKLYPGKDEKTY